MTRALTNEEIAILRHTRDRAGMSDPKGGRLYCSDSPAMQDLVAMGLMESAGFTSWCPDEYFRLTDAGRRMLETLNSFQASEA